VQSKVIKIANENDRIGKTSIWSVQH